MTRQQRTIRQAFRNLKKPPKRIAATLGDGKGNVEVEGYEWLCYARIGNRGVPIKIYNVRSPHENGLDVWVGADDINPQLVQVLGMNYNAGSAYSGNPHIGKHAKNHRRDQSDTVWIEGYQVTDLGVYVDGETMIATVFPGRIMVNGVPVDIVQEDIDLTASVPGSGSLWVLVYLDSTGDILTLAGANKNLLDLRYTDIPEAAAGTIALAAVRLYAGQTFLDSDPTSCDVVDLRWSSMLHTHTSSQFQDQIKVWDYSENEYVYFEANSSGLAAALSAAYSYDSVYVPAGFYTGDFTLHDNVTVTGESYYSTFIYGKVTLAPTSSINNINVQVYGNSSGAVVGVVGAITDRSQIQQCVIVVDNAGTGPAYGVQFNGYAIDIRLTYIRAHAASGNARCLYSASTPTGSTQVHETIFANTNGGLSDTPDANWKVADGVIPYCYGCSWHQSYSIGTEIAYQVGDRASIGEVVFKNGVAGGQTIYGGTGANDDLYVYGTSHATKTTSYVLLQPTGGYVGIGNTTPVTALHVSESSTSSPRGIMSSQHNTGTDGARFHLRKSRGTFVSPEVVVTGDTIGRLVCSGYDGSNYLEMGSIQFDSEGTIASTRVPTNLSFWTATNATPSVLTERMRISSAGMVGVGAAPSAAYRMYVFKTDFDNSANQYGFYSQVACNAGGKLKTLYSLGFIATSNNTSGTVYGLVGVYGIAQANSSSSGNTGTVTGGWFQAKQVSANATPVLYGTRSSLQQDASTGAVTTATNVSAASTFNATTGTLYGVDVTLSVGSAGALTTYNGIRIDAPSITSGGTIANLYGLYIGNMTAGGTTSYAVYTNNGQVHFGDNTDWADGKNLSFGTSTGTKIGTDTNQKISFWNASPIVQPTTSIAAATFVANTSNIANDTATFDGYTIGQVVKALRNVGILA